MRLGLNSLSWKQIQWNQWNCSHVKGSERGFGLLLVFSCLRVRRLLYVPETNNDNIDQEGKGSVIFVKLRILLAISITAVCFKAMNLPYFFFSWKPIGNFFFPIVFIQDRDEGLEYLRLKFWKRFQKGSVEVTLGVRYC